LDVYAFRLSQISRPSHDLEKAIGFCLWKGKAGGEPMPTEMMNVSVGFLSRFREWSLLFCAELPSCQNHRCW
jgi:hypothetical protein